jgi:NAD-dependent deacetylase
MVIERLSYAIRNTLTHPIASIQAPVLSRNTYHISTTMTHSASFPDEFLKKLHSATSIAVLTGAGISAESGVPTFRGHKGLWKKFKPEELATVDAFLSNPDLVWEWYRHRREILTQAEPNPGHLALRDLEELFSEFTLITQNIDGLHQQAGSQRVVELHGNIRRNRCLDCGNILESVDREVEPVVPRCPCGGMLRPDVVWFGESLPRRALEDAYLAATRCQVFFSIGTSAVVQPAALLPGFALENGAYVVEINLEPTDLSAQVQLSLRGKSGEILPRLVENLSASRER